jgi:hypothetical protein
MIFNILNEELYGKEVMIGTENYTFLCAYRWTNPASSKEHIMIMLREDPTGLVREFIFSNELGLRIL